MKTLLPVLAGLAAGILSGWGVGGGTILMVWLTAFAKTPRAEARSVNLLFFLPVSVCALYWHIKNGRVAWRAAVPAAVAGGAAAFAAALLAGCLSGQTLHRLFSVFLIAAGVREMLYKPSETG